MKVQRSNLAKCGVPVAAANFFLSNCAWQASHGCDCLRRVQFLNKLYPTLKHFSWGFSGRRQPATWTQTRRSISTN